MARVFPSVLALLVGATVHTAAQQPNRAVSQAPSPRTDVARATGRIDSPRVLPGTRPDVFSTIQGNALTATNGSLTDAFVRLRDARFGQIVETQLTDKAGLFAFRSIDPGSYIVEILDANRFSVLAASQVLTAEPGQAISAIVKLPFRIPTFGGVFDGRPATVGAVTSQAASSGILATQASGSPTCEQVR